MATLDERGSLMIPALATAYHELGRRPVLEKVRKPWPR
jgi:hypothetical protein